MRQVLEKLRKRKLLIRNKSILVVFLLDTSKYFTQQKKKEFEVRFTSIQRILFRISVNIKKNFLTFF